MTAIEDEGRPSHGIAASLRFEHHPVGSVLGVGEPAPRLSWLVTAVTGTVQIGYEIEIARDGREARTVAVASEDSVLVPWPDEPLPSRAAATVRVRSLLADGTATEWTEPATIETGPLRPGDWSADFIAADETDEERLIEQRPAVILRDEFDLAAVPVAARLVVSALGVYEFEINGVRVGDEQLSPGWNSYQDRLRYQTFDVTDALRAGGNGWGARLADGWYRGRYGFNGGNRDIYGSRTALIAELHVLLADGGRVVHTTHPGWTSHPSGTTRTGLLEGETYDAGAEPVGWSEPGGRPVASRPVEVLAQSRAVLAAPDGPPVREIERIRPRTIAEVAPGVHLLDFGQNLVGRLRFRVRGPRGTTIVLRHAEVLQGGRIYTVPLRGAAATDRYVVAGGEVETWQPRFTIHGFRYAEIEGWPGTLSVEDIEAVVLHTDLRPTAAISTSSDDLDQLMRNIRWGMRGNFVDVPTDCPQRDERLGWTGDLQVFAPTAATYYDVTGMLIGWMRDVLSDQAREGTGVPALFSPDIPVNMPFPVPPGNLPAAGWSDAIVRVPVTLFERSGDDAVLDLAYPGMRAWIDALERIVGPSRVWDQGFQFGDWLDPSAPPDAPSASTTDPALVATAYFADTTAQLARVAEQLGRAAHHRRYRALADEVVAAFRRRFVLPNGHLTVDTQAAYALALRFDLLEPGLRQRAADRLAELVRQADHTISTGFLATPLVCDALTDHGHVDDAYGLLLNRTFPSWMHQVHLGATTIWERWDSMLADGTVNPGEMTSFNHYAFGAVGDFVFRRVGGISPAGPGYRRLRFAPRPGGALDWAETVLETPYGTASLRWDRIEGATRYGLVVPFGAVAEVDILGLEPSVVGPGAHVFEVADV